MSDLELVDNMEQVWRSIADLCSPLTEEQWKTPTECPGWSVQDQVSHLAGSESGSWVGRDPTTRQKTLLTFATTSANETRCWSTGAVLGPGPECWPSSKK